MITRSPALPRNKSADRALEVMEELVRSRRGLTHSELSFALGIPKSSLTKILSSLISIGYLQREGGALYQTGPRWNALVKASFFESSIPDLVRPHLGTLVADTGETSGFNRVIERQIETVAAVISPRQLQFTMIEGDRAPIHTKSSGLVILANASEDVRQRYHAHIVQSDEHSPLHDEARFNEAMNEIRDKGYAEVHGFREGIVGLGVPLFSENGCAMASLNVGVPEARFDDDVKAKAITSLTSVAGRLARLLEGCIEPEPLVAGVTTETAAIAD